MDVSTVSTPVLRTRPPPKEAFYFYNYLTGLAKSLENKYTTIDLRNESSVTGKIVSVDGYMNIEMEDVVFYDARGYEFPFDTFFTRSRNIRYIHIPLEISIIDAIKQSHQPKRKIIPKKKTYKKKRAIVNYQKTLAELATSEFVKKEG